MFAQIDGLKDIGLEIVQHISPGRQIGRLFVGVIRLDTADPGGLGQAGWSDLLPTLSTVCCHMGKTIV